MDALSVTVVLGAVLAVAHPQAGDRQGEHGAPLSHPPLRELPSIADRPMSDGPAYYVDAKSGRDSNPGSEDRPWSTINHSLNQLQAGDTLYLRAGSYFENVYCAVAGTEDKPITIRAYPGERVLIDGGTPEFQAAPETAWRPLNDGAGGEYISTRTFKNIRDVVGLFGDSNVGLQTYWHNDDLRAANEMWIVDKQTKAVDPVYCGPGLWYNKQTGCIHARLAHTHIDNPEVANYAGETDPRKLPLVIAPFRSVPLFVDQAMHVRFQDLVVRGGGLNTVVLQFGVDVEFDNVTIFAGTYGIRARSTGPFRMVNSAVHGNIPPWGFRNENSLHTYTARFYDPFFKEPGTQTRNVARLPTHALVVTEGTFEFEVFAYPRNHDWEISHCDFTDGHDGVYLSGYTIRFHHNRVDNIQDDGIYLSSPSPGFNDDIFIYQNLITRSLMAFGCHSRGGPNGNIYIFRNIADLRKGVNAGRPSPDHPHGRISLPVYSDTRQRSVVVDVAGRRIPEIEYKLVGNYGSVLFTSAGRTFWGHLGGYTDSVTGRGGAGGMDGSPFVRRSDYPTNTRRHAPRWTMEDGSVCLRFDGKGNYIALPQGVLPRRGCFTLSFEIKQTGDPAKPQVLFAHHGNYIGSLKILVENGKLAGSFTNEQGETFRFDTDLQIVKDHWHRVVVSYDLESMRFRLDGRDSPPFVCRGPGLYNTPSVFGGMGGSTARSSTPEGNPGWFEGYLRALTVRHRPPSD